MGPGETSLARGRSMDVAAVKEPRRTAVFFASLLGLLTTTSGLLLLLAPGPLPADAARSLFAAEPPRTLDVIFDTQVPVHPERWTYIYIRHSRTSSGNAWTLAQASNGLADHFVIGNGDGCVDGEVQVGHRWNGQLPPGRPPGTGNIDPACISICLIGDFDRTLPTPTQMRRLVQLVGALQQRLGIPAQNVYLIQQPGIEAGVGQHFPIEELRRQLLP
jgi:hypothetical protein